MDFYVEVKKSSEKQENFLLFYQLESVPRNSGLEDYLSLLNLPNMLLQRYSFLFLTVQIFHWYLTGLKNFLGNNNIFFIAMYRFIWHCYGSE